MTKVAREKKSFVLGTGCCLPKRVLTNAELEGMVDTSDDWITTRTGITTRRISGPGEETSKLATGAARQALVMAGLTPADINIILLATVSSEMSMPSCACLVQKELDAVNAFAFDLNAACSGFLYALDMADAYLKRDPGLNILVIGAETLSSRVNWQDRDTCVLFGDGAGACLLNGANNGSGIIASKMFSDGRLYDLLCMDSALGLNPDLNNHQSKGSFIRMIGRDVFRYAVRAMVSAVEHVLSQSGLTVEDITLFIPHQANIRIVKSLIERLNVPSEKIYVNIDKYGNTSAASIPIALDEANREGRLKKNDLLLCCAFGSGFTWGATIIRW